MFLKHPHVTQVTEPDTESSRCECWQWTDYLKEMDCHYFDSWSVHRWSMFESWSSLMCQSDIVDSRVFVTFDMSFRLINHERHPASIFPLASRMFSSVILNAVHSAFCQLWSCWLIIIASAWTCHKIVRQAFFIHSITSVLSWKIFRPTNRVWW